MNKMVLVPATEQDTSKELPEERTVGERGPPGIKAKTNRGSGVIKHGSKRKGIMHKATVCCLLTPNQTLNRTSKASQLMAM